MDGGGDKALLGLIDLPLAAQPGSSPLWPLLTLAVLFLVTLKVGWRTAPDANDQETTVADWPWRQRMRAGPMLRKRALLPPPLAAASLLPNFPLSGFFRESTWASFFFFFSFQSKDANFSRASIFAKINLFFFFFKGYFDKIHLSSSLACTWSFFLEIHPIWATRADGHAWPSPVAMTGSSSDRLGSHLFAAAYTQLSDLVQWYWPLSRPRHFYRPL